MVFRNMKIKFSVGLSIGSVPPNINDHCVRNITFQNVEMETPIKAIYVKTNPGTSGDGEISNINYVNITAKGSLWYPIWIGPQQQQQPHSTGTGCSWFFPLDPVCPTQPRINVTGIYLQDVVMTEGISSVPGVFLGNATNPMKGIVLKNVTNSGKWSVNNNYYCGNAHVVSIDSNPVINC
jgi:polygalacturonase